MGGGKLPPAPAHKKGKEGKKGEEEREKEEEEEKREERREKRKGRSYTPCIKMTAKDARTAIKNHFA